MSEQKTTKTSNDAKERLLQAAIKIFAIYGFEGASTRMLVKEAGVNISAIPYYFESKDGLYIEVIRHITRMATIVRGDVATHVRDSFQKGDMNEERALGFLHQIITSMATFLLIEQTSPHIAQIVVREQMQPSDAFDVLYKDLMEPIHKAMAHLVAYLTGLRSEDEQVILCTHSIMGQLMAFKTHHALIKRRLGGEIPSDKVIHTILKNTDAILATWRNQESKR